METVPAPQTPPDERHRRIHPPAPAIGLDATGAHLFIGGICAKRRYCLLIRTHDHRCRFLDVTRLLYHLLVLRLLHKILKCVCAR